MPTTNKAEKIQVHHFADGEILRVWHPSPEDSYAEFEIIDADPHSDVYIRGNVKWDGCMNWIAGENCMAHFCRPEQADALAIKFKKKPGSSHAAFSAIRRISRRDHVNLSPKRPFQSRFAPAISSCASPACRAT